MRLRSLQEKLGPGLLYAATAVGVSHLVQSTRAGATYGMIMAGYVVFMCLLKYPTFFFGARYTAATGESLVQGYGRMGKWLLYLLFVMQLFEFTFGIAGVAIVSAGLAKNVLGLALGDIPMAVTLVAACLVMLAVGRYALLEDVTRVLVVVFSVGTVVAAVLAFGGIERGEAALSADMTLDVPTILFLVAVAGWMPTGTAAAVSISLWIKAKQKRVGRAVTVPEADFDFNLGYFAAIFTAVCFVVLGTYVLFIPGVAPDPDSAGFAAQLMSLFTATLGAWTWPIIAVASMAVMLSTLITLIDLLPRTSAAIVTQLWPDSWGEQRQTGLYLGFIGLELVLLLAVLLGLMQNFATFIDLVTSMGFIVAPVIAWLNHIVMFSSHVPAAHRPGKLLFYWSRFTIASLSVVGLVFLYLKLSA